MTTVIQRKAGSTDVSVLLRIIDSSDGTPETGVVYNTSGIDLKYRREGATVTSITEAELSTPAVDDAHTDGGFIHIGDGYYRLDLPDAACAAGVTGVLVHGTVTGMVVLGCYIQLVAYDPFDTVRLGLTALPNAAANAAGGLPVSDAGGLDLDALDNNVSATLTDTGTTLPATLAAIAGYLDTEIADVLADTNELQTDWADGGRLDLLIDSIVTAVVGTISELSQAAPPAEPTLKQAIMLEYMALRNKVDITSSYKEVHNDASTVIAKKALTDDGTTYSEAEMESGP